MCHPNFPSHAKSVFLKQVVPLTLLCGGLILLLPLSSCGTSCIMGVFNSGGTVSSNTSACVNNKAMGTMAIRIAASAPTSEGPMAPHLLHLFVSIRGIEAHPSATADPDSPDWQELAPDLATHPALIDLMATSANPCASGRIEQTVVPAGVYRQIRLRLLTSDPALEHASSQANACGTLGPHCAVAASGKISPLIIDAGLPDFRISPDSMPNGFFSVLPDTLTSLTLEFNTYSSLAVPSGEALRLIPAFSVAAAPTCESLPTLLQPEGP